MGTKALQEKALNDFQFPEFKQGIQSRIVKNVTDRAWLKDNSTNLVVRKLDKSTIDNSDLKEQFQQIGDVVCCKVSKTMKEDAGEVTSTSNGYGYVRFEKEEEAAEAVSKLNGKKIAGQEIVVERFDKDAKAKVQAKNNLYVKEFPKTWSEDDLKQRFEKYGKLGSVAIKRDDNGNSEGFGFVCFEKPENAATAIKEEHNSVLPSGQQLYVCFNLSKEQRMKEMKRCNVYIKNFGDSDEAKLYQFFSGYGAVKNVKLFVTELDDGTKVPKGFGFVCFEKPDIANKIVDLADKGLLVLSGNVLYCSLFQSKEERQRQAEREQKEQNEKREQEQL